MSPKTERNLAIVNKTIAFVLMITTGFTALTDVEVIPSDVLWCIIVPQTTISFFWYLKLKKDIKILEFEEKINNIGHDKH